MQEVLFNSNDLAALIDLQVKSLWHRMRPGDVVPFMWRRQDRRRCSPTVKRLPGVTAVGHSDRGAILHALRSARAGDRVGYRFLGEGDIWIKRGRLWVMQSPFFPKSSALVGLLIEEESDEASKVS